MKLQGTPFDASAEIIADWLELKCIASLQNRVNFSELSRSWEANRESEDTSPVGDDAEFEGWLQPVMQVIQRRLEFLRDSYPFDLVLDDTEFKFIGAPNTHAGRLTYLLCLFLSTVHETEIFESIIDVPPTARDLFQIVSTWAAAGVVHGSSFGMGWPRPEKSKFLDALRDVLVNRMADGEISVVDKAPPASNQAEKDDGIDIIAWRERPDRCAGKPILMGQVASGADWENKPIQHHIEGILKNWISKASILSPYPALFIPFSLVPEQNATHQEQVRFVSAKYGAVYYRDVLPAYAAQGIHIAKSGLGSVHRSNEISKIVFAKITYIKRLRAAQQAA